LRDDFEGMKKAGGNYMYLPHFLRASLVDVFTLDRRGRIAKLSF
ncbi:unnamed protein product, partial [marine sediment metagenome]